MWERDIFGRDSEVQKLSLYNVYRPLIRNRPLKTAEMADQGQAPGGSGDTAWSDGDRDAVDSSFLDVDVMEDYLDRLRLK
jgi:hypothetical protein